MLLRFRLRSLPPVSRRADFNTLSATLPPPFHLSFPLIKYWDGQPVTYVCRRRSKNPVDAEGVFWSVAFEIVDREATEQLKERGGAVVHLGEGGGASDGEKGEKVVGNAEGDTSDDLD